MRTARIDWTDQTVEYIDEEFEVAIPGEGGQFLSAVDEAHRIGLGERDPDDERDAWIERQGVDVASIDMGVVLDFARRLNCIGSRG